MAFKQTFEALTKKFNPTTEEEVELRIKILDKTIKDIQTQLSNHKSALALQREEDILWKKKAYHSLNNAYLEFDFLKVWLKKNNIVKHQPKNKTKGMVKVLIGIIAKRVDSDSLNDFEKNTIKQARQYVQDSSEQNKKENLDHATTIEKS